VRTVGLSGVSVHKQTAAAFLAGDRSAFDVVFLDPPYDLSADKVSTVLHSLTRGWLADAALVVLERACRSEGVTWPAGFTVDWQRRFGDTCVQRAVWYGHEQVPPT
jgi:16S rRNA (guanine966-N2)-methyltransferase